MGNLLSKKVVGYMYVSSHTSDIVIDKIIKHDKLAFIHLKPKSKIDYRKCLSKTINVYFSANKYKFNINIIPLYNENILENNKIYTKYSSSIKSDISYENSHYFYVKNNKIKKIVCIIKNNFI